MGSKGSNASQTTEQSQSYSANPVIKRAGKQAISMATEAANQPFQMPVAPVAGFNPFQQQAFGQVQDMQGDYAPYISAARSYYDQSAAPITGQDVAQYYNPMAGNIFAQLAQQQGQQWKDVTGKLTGAAGGVGAERIAVGQGQLANQQRLASGQIAANLYQQALQAAQAQKQMAAGAAGGMLQTGAAGQTGALRDIATMGQAGLQQQQQSQAELNAPYQNRLAEIAYPFQTAQYLAGITGGLAPAFGGTTSGQSTTTYQPAQPAAWQQAVGLGMQGLGLAMGMPGMPGMGMGKGSTGGSGPAMAFMGGNSNPYMSGASWGMVKDGGRIEAKAGGGEVEAPQAGVPSAISAATHVPRLNLPMGAGHSGPLTGAISLEHAKIPGQKDQTAANTASKAMSSLGSLISNRDEYEPDTEAQGGGVFPKHFYSGGGEDSYLPGGGGAGGGWGEDDLETLDSSKPFPLAPEAQGLMKAAGNFGGEMGRAARERALEASWRSPSENAGITKDELGAPQPNISRAAEYPTAMRFRPTTGAPALDYANPPPNVLAAPMGAAGQPAPQVSATGLPVAPSPALPSGDGSELAMPLAPAQPQLPAPAQVAQAPGAFPHPLVYQPAEGAGTTLPQSGGEEGPATPNNPIAKMFAGAAERYGIPTDLAIKLGWQESRFNPGAVSPKGATGPAQLMPSTARELGVKDIRNPAENIDGGMRYLRQMYDKYGDWKLALAAYNAGPGRVDEYLNSGRPLPQETMDYVATIAGGSVPSDAAISSQTRRPSFGEPGEAQRSRYALPRTMRPYPDATDRNWGQKMARSPWMSLVKAGATVASTPGPFGVALSKGIASGVDQLQGERAQLRNEETMNQRAKQLHQTAQHYLDQYERMTPYQRENLQVQREVGRFTPYNYIDAEGKPRVGVMNSKTGELLDPVTREPVTASQLTRPSGSGAGAGSTALIRNIEYMTANGLAPDKASAMKLLRTAATNDVQRSALENRWFNSLQKVPALATADESQLRAMAKKIVTDSIAQAQAAPATEAATPADAGTEVGQEKDFTLGDGKKGKFKKIKAGPDTDRSTWEEVKG